MMPWVMSRIERISDLGGQLKQQVCGQRLSADSAVQSPAFQQLHRDELARLVLLDVINWADIRVVEGGSCASLAPEPRQRQTVGGHFSWQKLQRYQAAEFGVFGLVDDSHAPGTDLLQHAILFNHRAG